MTAVAVRDPDRNRDRGGGHMEVTGTQVPLRIMVAIDIQVLLHVTVVTDTQVHLRIKVVTATQVLPQVKVVAITRVLECGQTSTLTMGAV